MVEYTTPIEILKPADMARGNRILFFEVNNRGNKLALGAFNEGVTGGAADRNGLTSPGDGWLMRSGYTMVWFGWEMDVLPGMNRIGMPPIIAHNHDGSSDHRHRALGDDHARRDIEPADRAQPADPGFSARQL